VEFGAGDGSPVLSALLKSPYRGRVTAFELNAAAADVARSRAAQLGLSERWGEWVDGWADGWMGGWVDGRVVEEVGNWVGVD